MDLITITSIVIRLIAMGWSVALLRKLRDWRIVALTAMFGLMALQQAFAVMTSGVECLFCFEMPHLHFKEIPGLAVSLLAFIVVIFLGRMFMAEKKSKGVLAQSQQILQSLIDNATAVIYLKDSQGRYRLINRRFQDLFHVAQANVVGKTDRDLFPKDIADGFRTNDKLVLRRGKVMEFDEEAVHPGDGQLHYYISNKFPLYDANGVCYAVCGISTDITDRKRREQKLRMTQFIMNHAGDAVFCIDKDGRFIEVNQTACSKLGYSREELLSMSVADVDPYFPQDAWPRHWQQMTQQKLPAFESVHRTKCGRLIPVEIVTRHIQFEGVECSCAFARDISDRTQVQQQLDQFFTISLELMCIAGPDGYFKKLNANFSAVLGYSDQELLARPFLEFVHPDDRAATHAELVRLNYGESVSQFQNRYLCKDGSCRWLEWNAVAVEDSENIYAVARDITERKQSEIALKDSRERFLLFMKHLPGLAYMKDHDHRPVFANEAFMKMLNVTADQPLDESSQGVIPTEVAKALHKNDDWVMSHRQTLEVIEDVPINNKIHHFLTHKFPIPRGTNKPLLGGISIDVTDHIRTQKDLKQQTARFRAIFQGVPDAMVLVDANHRIVMCNPGVTRTFGYAPDYVLGREISLLYARPEDFRRQVSQRFHEQATDDHEPYIIDYRRNDGEVFPGESMASVIRSDDGDFLGYLGLIRDVADRVQAEHERVMLESNLRQSQKMQALGTLAGGIAHDFNNVLTVIFGHLDIVKKSLPKHGLAYQSLDMIEKVAHQGSSVTRSLLTFAHKGPSQKRSIQLTKLVRESLRMLHRLIPASITVVEDLPNDDGPWVRVDPGQIQQVLMNLTVNARDAMNDGGMLRIQLRHPLRVSSAATRTDAALPPDHEQVVVLEVSDTGPGMDEERLNRVFEPFFTTKPRGSGTGLGLAVVHGIITDHEGQITVDSKPGQGCRVTIRLPICQPPDPTPRSPDHDKADGDGQLILLAEDNVFVRDVMASALGSAGYHVASAEDGEQAMSLFHTHEDQAHLAILDLDMPKLGGLSCLDQIRQIRQDLPVVLVTGNSDLLAKRSLAENEYVLRKPFRMNDLVEFVGRTLKIS